MPAKKPKDVTEEKPKKALNRKMKSVKTDPFYDQPYKVLERTSLNQFDPVNNSNKFYIAELHESEATGEFRFYANYGRVGVTGTPEAEALPDLSSAQRKFHSKVREKLRKGYVEVALATVTAGSSEGSKQLNAEALGEAVTSITAQSSLPVKVQSLVTHLYEEANVAVSMSLSGEVKSDISAPLGNLGVKGIDQGRVLLRDISEAQRVGDMGLVERLSTAYYNNIPRKLPHNLRKDRSWVLSTQDQLSKELDILELYEDSLRLLPLMSSSSIDNQYAALACDISDLTDEALYAKLQHYVESTKAPNHRFRLKVNNIYALRQHNAPAFDDTPGNVQMLFHGSRSANLVGILSSYLKLPNRLGSNIHKTGSMFGDGVYFADRSTKSANYSFGSFTGSANKRETCFLFLADVALGRVKQFESQQYDLTQAPRGFDSVQGVVGRYLENNEFIVYRESQACLRYLVEVEKVR